MTTCRIPLSAGGRDKVHLVAAARWPILKPHRWNIKVKLSASTVWQVEPKQQDGQGAVKRKGPRETQSFVRWDTSGTFLNLPESHFPQLKTRVIIIDLPQKRVGILAQNTTRHREGSLFTLAVTMILCRTSSSSDCCFYYCCYYIIVAEKYIQ